MAACYVNDVKDVTAPFVTVGDSEQAGFSAAALECGES